MKKTFDLNGSSMSSGYWGPRPVPSKKKNLSNPDTIDETIESMPNLNDKLTGSSKSDDNASKNRSRERKKIPIHYSKSDENDYAKSHLIKEKEMQDKKRNLVFTENIFNMPHKPNEIKPFLISSNDPLKASQSKPPINPKKLQSDVNNTAILCYIVLRIQPQMLRQSQKQIPVKLTIRRMNQINQMSSRKVVIT